jgi:release factor glutamine methyltransferase
VNLKQALKQSREVLSKANLEDASLEGEILLRHALQIDRAQLYSDLNRELSAPQAEKLWQLVQRRREGEPTAYITGHREFYGLDFYIDRRVLIPRPETELMVEKALALERSRHFKSVADIGTGCGAIAISLALNLPGLEVYAIDVSAEALEVARRNCLKHGLADRIQLRHGDTLAPLPEPVDLITANLPYVTVPEISRSGLAAFEPRLALDGGRDGLDKIRKLCLQAGDKLRPYGGMLLEIGQGQGRAVTDLLGHHFPSAAVEIIPDLQGIERVISLCLTPDRATAKLII